MDNSLLSEISSALNTAKSILIVTHRSPSIDSLAGSLALYLSLTQNGKNVTVACPSQPLVEHSDLVGIDKVKTKLEGKNILISIEDYQEGTIEKVSYTEEVRKFSLIIQPGENTTITEDKIKISLQGITAELIISIDTSDLTYLDNIYTQEQKIYSNVPIINIDKHSNNTKYGKINLLDPSASSISELITDLLKALNLQIDQDIATNLLLGIQAATRNFQNPNSTANAFEAAALCLRSGARRIQRQPVSSPETPTKNSLVGNPAKPQTVVSVPISTPVVGIVTNPESSAISETPVNPNPPDDWLQPKIYKGSSPV